jgi:hypothetical protein
MPDTISVHAIGELDVVASLLVQLHQAGAVESAESPSLILVGATTVLEAELLLMNVTPSMRRRAVIVGIDEELDFGFSDGTYAGLLGKMMVLGSLPTGAVDRPTITSFIGARGPGDGLAKLVGAGFWKLGPAHHKVWFDVPAVDAGAFLVQLVTAIERESTWFDEPVARARAF